MNIEEARAEEKRIEKVLLDANGSTEAWENEIDNLTRLLPIFKAHRKTAGETK